MRSLRFLAGLAVVVIAALALVGCGDDPAALDSDAEPTAATVAVPTERPTVISAGTRKPTAMEPTPTEDILQQADAPTHDKATPWGLITINPVIDGVAVLNPQDSPVPPIRQPPGIRVSFEGSSALEDTIAAGIPVPEVPVAMLQGSIVTGVQAARDGDQFAFFIYYRTEEGAEERRAVEVQGFTPVSVVTFQEHPDNAVHDFVQSYAVNGNPTLAVFPDKGTANPANQRTVPWSQGGAVYFVITNGLFTDDEAIAIASEVSRQEAERQQRP